MDNTSVIFPPALKPGDTIAICSPAGAAKTENVLAAAKVLEDKGWKVKVMPHALGSYGNYSAPAEKRLEDLRNALADPEVKAVLCSRGGYGVVHILEELDKIDLKSDPKWIIGFSDISALHALAARKGVASIHASMAKQIKLGPEDPDNAALFSILEGERTAVTLPPCPRYDRPGIATGRLVGGNLAVLADLIGTKYDMLTPGVILFIEDVAEPIYKIERILYQMRISGVLPNLAGLLVGQFTEYHSDKSYHKMEDMIADMVAPYTYPVAFNVPIGHVNHNIPVIENATVTLRVNSEGVSLIYW